LVCVSSQLLGELERADVRSVLIADTLKTKCLVHHFQNRITRLDHSFPDRKAKLDTERLGIEITQLNHKVSLIYPLQAADAAQRLVPVNK
jgi:hypothetical protein